MYERIVCMTEETTETLYLLGEQDRIVGISGYTVRPPEARREKPRISAFTSANIDKIKALEPDLVLGFSDLQAGIAADLLRAGLEVHVFNHRSVEGILRMVRGVAAMAGATERGAELADSLADNIERIRVQGAALARRPRVYFEEWDDPMISGIRWVSELVEIAGGQDCFPELAVESLATNRIVATVEELRDREPDIIIGSWCGKKFRPERVAARSGLEAVPAVRDNEIHEVKSAIILQPGPAALTDGVAALHEIIASWAARHGAA